MSVIHLSYNSSSVLGHRRLPGCQDQVLHLAGQGLQFLSDGLSLVLLPQIFCLRVSLSSFLALTYQLLHHESLVPGEELVLILEKRKKNSFVTGPRLPQPLSTRPLAAPV